MKKHLSNLILITLTSGIFAGCASLTGVTNWKENTFESPLGKDATVKIATEAIARIGTVSFTDPATGTVNGVCQQQVDGAVTVYGENGKTMVIVKSKLDVNENSMVIETGDRQNCINHIVDEMKTLGCALTPQIPAS
jgi:hypothetical protein